MCAVENDFYRYFILLFRHIEYYSKNDLNYITETNQTQSLFKYDVKLNICEFVCVWVYLSVKAKL